MQHERAATKLEMRYSGTSGDVPLGTYEQVLGDLPKEVDELTAALSLGYARRGRRTSAGTG